MTQIDGRPTVPGMTCAEVADLAGLYVLDALEPGERDQVRTHLATCPQSHAEMRELGGVVPALATTVEPLDSPPELKARVMAAVAAEPQAGVAPRKLAPAIDRGMAERPLRPAARVAWRPPSWASWGAAIAAVVVLAVVGVWAFGLQSRADVASRRDAILSDAIAAASQPGSMVAVLQPSGSGGPSGSGLAVVSGDGRAYVVLVGLPQAPAGQTYQAWYIADDRPTSAGLLSVDADGYALLHDDEVLAGTEVVALTIEPSGGSDQPSTDPFAVGVLRPV